MTDLDRVIHSVELSGREDVREHRAGGRAYELSHRHLGLDLRVVKVRVEHDDGVDQNIHHRLGVAMLQGGGWVAVVMVVGRLAVVWCARPRAPAWGGW